jgi:NAD(P)H-dependent FMN reductase
VPKLNVIVASTRPGRVGIKIGSWFADYARQHGKFDVELVDLKEVNLPMMDEPNHPVKRQYQHDHTKAWSASVNAADAFILVTPEYNYGLPPALVNALDYLFVEWNYKPAAFVSYGGASGGMRSVQMTKQILTTLKIMPSDTLNDAAAKMLDELLKWSNALQTLRA